MKREGAKRAHKVKKYPSIPSLWFISVELSVIIPRAVYFSFVHRNVTIWVSHCGAFWCPGTLYRRSSRFARCGEPQSCRSPPWPLYHAWMPLPCTNAMSLRSWDCRFHAVKGLKPCRSATPKQSALPCTMWYVRDIRFLISFHLTCKKNQCRSRLMKEWKLRIILTHGIAKHVLYGEYHCRHSASKSLP